MSADEASDVLIGADPGLDVIPGPVKTRRREPTEKSVDSTDENATLADADDPAAQ